MNPLHVFFNKLFFGKFSYHYQQKSKNFAHRPKPGKKYLKSCSRTDALNHYCKVTDENPGLAVFDTSQNLQFGDIDFGATFKDVLKSNRKYDCYDVAKYGQVIWQRLGYKERVFNHGVRRVYHFLDREFFFGELFFSDIRKVDENLIAAILIKKYTGKENEVLKGNFRINGKDSFIFFENNGINISIKYISNANQTINAKLKEISQVKFNDMPEEENLGENLL